MSSLEGYLNPWMNFKDFWQDSLIQKMSRLGHLSIDYLKYFSFLMHSKFLPTFLLQYY